MRRQPTHPVVDLVFSEAQRQRLSKTALARRAGVSYSQLVRWQIGRYWPRFRELAAVLDVLGYDITAIRRPERTPQP